MKRNSFTRLGLAIGVMVVIVLAILWFREPLPPPLPKARMLAAVPDRSGAVPLPETVKQTTPSKDGMSVEQWKAEFLSSLSSEDLERMEKAIKALTRLDPNVAVALAQAMQAGPMRDDAMRCVAQTWADINPAAAETWAAHLGDNAERETMLSYVCYQVVQVDPRHAAESSVKYGIGDKKGMLPNLVQQWAEKDYANASQWTLAQPAGELRDANVFRLALVLAPNNGTDAANLALKEIPPGPTQEEAVISVLHQWAIKDSKAASAWVATFPPDEFRDRAEAEVSGVAAQLKP